MLHLTRLPHQRIVLDLSKIIKKAVADEKARNEQGDVNPPSDLVIITFCGMADTPGYATIGIDASKKIAIIREEILDEDTRNRLAAFEGKETYATTNDGLSKTA